MDKDGFFRVIIIGGTGQVGNSVVRALLESSKCIEVVAIIRKVSSKINLERVRTVVIDTDSSGFSNEVESLARDMQALGDRVAAISCVGVGSGSLKWSEDQLKKLEVGVIGNFAGAVRRAGVAHFCLLSAAGANASSSYKYTRVMGLKERSLISLDFPRLAVFRPGIILGNAHTPRWVSILGKFIPNPWGNIHQNDIAKAFAQEINNNVSTSGVCFLDNNAMRKAGNKQAQ